MTNDEARALTYGTTIYHKTLRNSDGSMLRARVTGKVRTWKRQPERFQIPMKHGLRDCFYITNDGVHQPDEWSLVDIVAEEKEREFKIKRRADHCVKMGLIGDVPDTVLRDALIDANYDETLARLIAFID